MHGTDFDESTGVCAILGIDEFGVASASIAGATCGRFGDSVSDSEAVYSRFLNQIISNVTCS